MVHFRGEMANQHSIEMNEREAAALHEKLSCRAGFHEITRPFTAFCFEGQNVVAAYYPKKGRLLVQGKGADDFLEFVLLRTPGADPVAPIPIAPVIGGTDMRPHFGVDESGKGDYFGPLVVAGVYSDERTAGALVKLGCRDSKAIKDDNLIIRMAEQIKALPGVAHATLCLPPTRYNEVYAGIGNLNKLLARGHARIIAALHEKVPSCPRALCDQFAGRESVLRDAVRQRGVCIELEQRHRAEADVAVAAASILARARFVRWMREASEACGCKLPLGCAPHVKKAARVFLERYGRERLGDVAKLHFKVTGEL